MINYKFILIFFFIQPIVLKSQEYFDKKLIPFKELIVSKLNYNQEFLSVDDDSVKYNMVYSRLIFEEKDLAIYEISTLKSHNLLYILITKKDKILLFDKINYEIFNTLITIMSDENNCYNKELIDWILESIGYNKNLSSATKLSSSNIPIDN
ncbi:hypothetical protein [Moheibacter stercoris]|uniref:TPM domain-containing protein n=1 Tax=Moheibacter stercoris TaxID=1628251 RepID=A0ABV2LPR5_9FLAO